MKILDEVGLSFDDVLLVPRKSTIDSRFDGAIDISSRLFCWPSFETSLPLISANMDTVTAGAMAKLMDEKGGLGIVHRFMSPEDQRMELPVRRAIACIGTGNSSRERFQTIDWRTPVGVLIDIAHGHCTAMIDQIKWVKDTCDLPVIAGNVATYQGALDLIAAGADSIKVGVGGGSMCSTRVNTGNGVPQLTAIIEVARAIQEVNRPVSLIADGGIRNAGDIIKCLACGADAVMIGKLLAGTDETPGDTFLGPNGIRYKSYRGMASFSAQKSWKGYASSVEGESMSIPYKGSAATIIDELRAGILSGMSYQDAHSIAELRKNAVFIRMTNNGLIESRPHGLLT